MKASMRRCGPGGSKTLFAVVVMATVVLTTSVLVMAVTTRKAEPGFPGSNGKVFFESDRSILSGDPSTTDSEIFAMNENGTGLTSEVF
jgi:hypothetical protein